MLLVSTPTPNTKATYSKHPGHLLQTLRPPTPNTQATYSKHPGHLPQLGPPTPNTQATYSKHPGHLPHLPRVFIYHIIVIFVNNIEGTLC